MSSRVELENRLEDLRAQLDDAEYELVHINRRRKEVSDEIDELENGILEVEGEINESSD